MSLRFGLLVPSGDMPLGPPPLLLVNGVRFGTPGDMPLGLPPSSISEWGNIWGFRCFMMYRLGSAPSFISEWGDIWGSYDMPLGPPPILLVNGLAFGASGDILLGPSPSSISEWGDI